MEWTKKKIPTYGPTIFLAARKIWQLSDAQREGYQRITFNCNIYTCVHIICVYVSTHIDTSRRHTSSEKNLSCAERFK